MGIKGLLKALRSVTVQQHLSDFSGLTAAVDASCWLHKGTYGCAAEICLGQDTDRYVKYCMNKVAELLTHDITPILVFDGAPLELKEGTEDSRLERREKHMAKGKQLMADGQRAAAYVEFTKAVDVTPEMAHRLIVELRAQNIEYVVAPYEADAQLAFLNRTGRCDVVITEDSDLIPFGCRTVLLKQSKTGMVDVIESGKIAANADLSMTTFNEDMLLDLCILSGCDYLSSIPGMGMTRAHRFVHKYRLTERILRAVSFEGGVVPKGYKERFRRARMGFRHQLVFDSERGELVPLTKLPEGADLTKLDFLGAMLPAELARGIARGDINPFTQRPFATPAVPRAVAEASDKPIATVPGYGGQANERVAHAKPSARKRSHGLAIQGMRKLTEFYGNTGATKAALRPFKVPRRASTSRPRSAPPVLPIPRESSSGGAVVTCASKGGGASPVTTSKHFSRPKAIAPMNAASLASRRAQQSAL